MATKPTLNDARWGETVAEVAGANNLGASEGKKDTGFGTTPEALSGPLLNWMFWQSYKWFKWLDVFLTSAHTWTQAQNFGAGIDVTGAATVNGAINATSVTASAAIAGATIAASGNATVGGQLTVTGDAFFLDDLTITDLLTAGRAIISGLLTAGSASISGALTAASATMSGAVAAATAGISGLATLGGALIGTGSGTPLQVAGTGQFNNNINVAGQVHQTGGSGSGGFLTETRVKGAAISVGDSLGGNGSKPYNYAEGDMFRNTNRLYIYMNGNFYLLNDPGAPIAPGALSDNGYSL